MAAAEPAAKKQKTDEKPADGAAAEAKDAEMKDAKPAEPEPAKELEQDAPTCKKPRLKEAAQFLVQDTTLNVLPSTESGLLMALTDGGASQLLAGARANVGLSDGRYLFEVKVIECVSPDGQANQARNQLRIGFASASSSLFIGDGPDSVCFDLQGHMAHNKQRTKVSGSAKLFVKTGSVLAVLLNLEKGSPNYNTVSFFLDGARVGPPQAVPDSLKGKTLFPAVTFKNMTAHVHFGPEPLAPLPFKCRMVQDATAAHTTVVKADTPTDGKYEVVMPVGLPDEGTFDWLDTFLQKNPKYTELSGRMIVDWAEKSGVSRRGGYKARSCNDKPDAEFGNHEMDDDSIRRALYAVAPLQERNYVVMEVKSGLLEDERKALLSRFPASSFKKVASVVMGEPPLEYKKRVRELVLAEKQVAMNRTFELQKIEKLRKKQLEKQRKAAEKAKKKTEREIKKKVEEAKKKAEEEKKKKEAAANGAEAKEDEAKESKEQESQKKEEEEKAEEEDDDEDEEVEVVEAEEEPPTAELTADEKKLSFRPNDVKDLTPMVMSSNFTKFTVPSKEEGFDELKYEWLKSSTKCKEYLKSWVLEKKLTSRVEELKPSAWFHEKHTEWQKVLKQWQSRQYDYNGLVKKKAAERESRKARAQALAKAAATTAAADAKKEEGKEAKEADAADAAKAEAAKAAADKAVEEAAADEAEAAAETKAAADFETLDIFGVDDVLDVGAGAPLFKEFFPEDWALASLAFELNVLVHAFRRDVEDPDRTGIHINHLAFYYQRYFKRQLTPADFGVATCTDIVGLLTDGSLYLTDKEVLASQLDSDMESHAIFVKLVEEARRYRKVQIDVGQEAAVLKIKSWFDKKGGSGGGKNWSRGGGGGGWSQPQQQMQQSWNDFGYGKAQQNKGGKGANWVQPYGKGGSKDGGKGGGKWDWQKGGKW